MVENVRYVNLGCGSRYHPDWINIDIAASSPNVISHDVTRDVPLSDSSCEVVYHSNLIEHIRRADVMRFMRECYRVLKPGGILRVATPDLEQICRIYLQKLEAGSRGDIESARDYEWIMLEMYDQTVREQSGGEMLTYLRQNPLPNEQFVFERIGEEGRNLVNNLRTIPSSVTERKSDSRLAWFRNARQLRQLIRGRVLRRMLGENDLRALRIGRFRLQGEAHQWMYDRFSLAQLMLRAGFVEPTQQTATSSRIPSWESFCLDTLEDGTAIKPDSFYMEASKPLA